MRIEYTQQMQTLLDREMDIEPHGKPQLCFDGSIEEYTEIAVTLGFLVIWGVTWPFAGYAARATFWQNLVIIILVGFSRF